MAAARENEIGRARCPICSTDRARLRVSGKSLAYICCDTCNVQVFARSDRSDEKLRALHIKEAAPADERPPVPTVTVPSAGPVPVIVPRQVTAPKAAMGWGWLG